MSVFGNNPAVRKAQQEVAKKVTQVVSEQIAKNGPKVIEAAGNAYKGAVNGLTSPTPPMPGKAGAADFVGQVGGAIAQEKFVKPVKNDIEKKATQQIAKAQTSVQSMVTKPATKPRSGSTSSVSSPMASKVAPTQNPGNAPTKPTGVGGTPKPSANRNVPQINNLMKPMSKPITPIQMKQPSKVALVKPTANTAKPSFGAPQKSPSTNDLLKQMNKKNAINRADE
jgi:hypothetical protein